MTEEARAMAPRSQGIDGIWRRAWRPEMTERSGWQRVNRAGDVTSTAHGAGRFMLEARHEAGMLMGDCAR